jgi:hypothetical protein
MLFNTLYKSQIKLQLKNRINLKNKTRNEFQIYKNTERKFFYWIRNFLVSSKKTLDILLRNLKQQSSDIEQTSWCCWKSFQDETGADGEVFL